MAWSDQCEDFDAEQREPNPTRALAPETVRARWTRKRITGQLLTLIRALFRVPEALEQLGLQGLLWSPDFQATKILIESASFFDKRATEIYPRIIVKANDFGSMIEGMMYGGDVRTSRYQDQHSEVRQGSHTISCIWDSEDSAEDLCDATFDQLVDFGPALLRSLRHYRVRTGGAPSILKEDKTRWFTPITVAWEYNRVWGVRHEQPILTSIALVAQSTS